MSLVVVGLNHRTVPVELLERMAVAPPRACPRRSQALARREHLAEVVLLSTCNRTEIYAHATLFHPAMQDVRDFLADTSGVDPDEFGDLLYTYHDDAAVAHLFGVAAGLDSMIIGEGEILGQVREAWSAAEHERAAARCSRARSATRSRSASAPAPRPASAATRCRCRRPRSRWRRAQLGTLDDRRVLVLGAGEMGEGMALALAGAGVGEIVVANRTRSRAEELARAGRRPRHPPRAGSPTRSTRATCCSCRPAPSDVLVERGAIETAMETRDGRALLIVDIGVPAQRRPGCGRGVRRHLLDIDDLRGVRRAVARAAPPGDRQGPRDHRRGARPLPDRAIGPRGRAARHRAPRARRGASAPASSTATGPSSTRSTPDAWEALDALTRSVVNKLLHEPTVRIKDAAGTAAASSTPTRWPSCSTSPTDADPDSGTDD